MELSAHTKKYIWAKYATKFNERDWQEFKADMSTIMEEGYNKGVEDEKNRNDIPKDQGVVVPAHMR